MHRCAQAFSQPIQADRWFIPTPVMDALGVIHDIALIQNRSRFAEAERLEMLLILLIRLLCLNFGGEMARQKMHLLLHYLFRISDVLPLQWYHRTFIGALLSGANWTITSFACLLVVILSVLLRSERAEACT